MKMDRDQEPDGKSHYQVLAWRFVEDEMWNGRKTSNGPAKILGN